MTKLKKYKSYKQSGIEWLGEIPVEWQELKIGQCFTERRTKVSDKDYPALSVTMKGVVPQLENAAKTMHGDDRKLVLLGDFVINSRSDRKGSSGIAKQDGSVSVINIVLKPLEIVPAFSEYLLKNHFFKEEFYRFGKGIVADLWTTRFSEMRSMYLPYPSGKDQSKIAAFLDYKTAKIDRFISKKKQLIQLLNEQKAGIISHAVTKGLNADVRLKESGVKWLGEIPEHWKIIGLKYSVGLNKNRSFLDLGSERNKVALENIESKTGRLLHNDGPGFEGVGTIFRSGDILFNKLRPYLAKVVVVSTEGHCVNEILVLTPDTEVWQTQFLKFRLLSQEFIKLVDDSTYGAKMPRASWTFIGSILLNVPPLSEQAEIADYIKKETSQIDKLIQTITKEIALVQEYKTALISEAVTGKIDVRDYVIPEYEKMEEVMEFPEENALTEETETL